jgi:hypothetical protein
MTKDVEKDVRKYISKEKKIINYLLPVQWVLSIVKKLEEYFLSRDIHSREFLLKSNSRTFEYQLAQSTTSQILL